MSSRILRRLSSLWTAPKIVCTSKMRLSTFSDNHDTQLSKIYLCMWFSHEMFISNLNLQVFHKLNCRRYFPKLFVQTCSVNKTHQNSTNLLIHIANQIKCFIARVTFTYLKTLKFFMLERTLSLMINNRNPQFYNCTLLLYLMWYCSIVEIPLRFI